MLRRANVVAGALDLLDAEGLDGLTMRKLGVALDVQAGALYRHFPNKEALLDAMADQLLERVDAPLPPHLPWVDQLELLGERLHTALLSRRDGARVVSGTFAPGPHTMAVSRRAAQVLAEAGFPPERAWEITFAVFYFILGHTIEEQAQYRMPAGDNWTARLAAAGLDTHDPLATGLRTLAAADPGERFSYGLRVFLAGIQQHAPEDAAGASTAENSPEFPLS
ncbi:TetR/AcrR family transcriptional regulator C-terminal domain-containing protein [Streptomyces sp. NRRL S-337]|uniref:TetR/AcrR family transcriptional regulator C-terminal domain-containing protein n=1 Tax=Streptomyces sp. NRRL S-337 TaxID=1463900 RepID=UPI0007C4F5F9|nr:TetR/AcrR family transcriptional regulator C-terminal domain-containing protein [Streptomyces sp. NRRL S-337]